MSFFKRLFGREEKKEPAMDRYVFLGMASTSLTLLRQKMTALEAEWQFESAVSMDLDQIGGVIRWSFEHGGMLEAPMQIIGVLDCEKNIWTWAWAHSVVKEALAADSHKVREWGEKHGVEKLTEGSWTCTPKDPWEMTAFAVQQCHAQGATMAQVGVDALYIAFGEVTVSVGLPAYALDPANYHDV